MGAANAREGGGLSCTAPAVSGPEKNEDVAAAEADERERAEDPAVVAEAVRTFAEKQLKAAWATLRNELEVQQRVWESVDLRKQATSTDNSSQDATVAARQEFVAEAGAIVGTATTDPAGAARNLRPFMEKARSQKLLNKGTEGAIDKVIKSSQRVQICEQLARNIQAARPSSPESGAGDAAEALLKACRLENPALERRVRRALNLTPTKQDLAAMEKKKAAASKNAADAKVKQVSTAAKVTQEQARKAIDNAGGDPDLALVMLLSEADEKSAKKQQVAELAAEKEKKKNEERRKHQSQEASTLAGKISGLAESTEVMAWQKLRDEIKVQISVWDSQALTGAPINVEAKQALQTILDAADADPANAVVLCEMVLQNLTQQRIQVTGGIFSAADGILDAERIARNRRELAEALNVVHTSLEAGISVERTAEQRQYLEGLISSSALSKPTTLANRVRKALDERGVDAIAAEERSRRAAI